MQIILSLFFHSIVLAFFVMSCQQKAVLKGSGQYSYLENVEPQIDRSEDLSWEVGKTGRVEISQGFSFRVHFNGLSRGDAEKLYEESGANAWLFRLSKISGSGSRVVGSSYVPFVIFNQDQGMNFSSVDQVYLSVRYAAAYMSERFRLLECPAFEHDKKILKIEVRDQSMRSKKIQLGPPVSIQGDMRKHELAPIQYNGGMSLLGNYRIEMALYDYRKKQRMGLFVPIGQVIEIASERPIKIPGCQGAQDEWKLGPIEKEAKRFRFGGD